MVDLHLGAAISADLLHCLAALANESTDLNPFHLDDLEP